LRDSGDQAALDRRAQARIEARAARAAKKDRVAAATAARRGETARRTAARTAQAVPRLKLDVATPSAAVANASAVEQALEAVAQAAAATRQSASAASAAANRIAALERTVEQLRGESKASREASAQLRDQLARAEATGSWTWPLLSLAAAMAALAVWLGLRLAAARRKQDKAWLVAARQADSVARAVEASNLDADDRLSTVVDEAKPQRTSPAPFVSTRFSGEPPAATPHLPASASALAPAWPPPAPVESWAPYSGAPSPARDASAPAEPSATLSSAPSIRVVSMPLPAPPPPQPQPATLRMADSLSPGQVTQPLPPGQRVGESGARDVSIDELLDLEQQAEFFVVLGQDDAAIELLVEHLRNTGGGSPLPYLKLLEIYRRRGDRADYERTRARFNHRFNAYAPEWEVDLQAGRSLEDYVGVLPRLQQAWARPIDSMAELEALLFRKSRGELFDLPAYRQVLFLYAIARDLLDRESAETGLVDLLLPLSDGGEFSNTAPTPFMDFGRDSQHGRADFEGRPTAPVDLDLSLEGDRPTSIFDALEERTQPGSRRR